MTTDTFSMCSPVFATLLRVLGAASSFGLLLSGVLRFGVDKLLFYTYWSVLATALTLTLILLRRKSTQLTRLVGECLPVVWNMTATASLGFWCLVAPFMKNMDAQSYFNHSLPLVFLSLELFFDQVKVGWRHMWFALGVAFFFLFAVNLPYTLMREPMYPGITYTNWLSYVALCLVLLLCAAETVGLRWAKRRILLARSDQVKPDPAPGVLIK